MIQRRVVSDEPGNVLSMRFRRVEIPDDLVSAARDGQLVIFVGAGASRDEPSSLPDFKQLVTKIGKQAGSPPSDAKLERPDVFLGDLVDLGVDVHSLVAQEIDAPGSTPNRLHHAVMALAAVHPPLRVVTTNYDRHLESAGRSDGLDPDVFRAPALPIGDDFTGVIHLHGELGQDPRQLVVTDTDFGHAYLREAWAARFLERMFAAFTVLFIGYSHGDVVMQYLARSLGREGRRYVVTDDAASADWTRLGLKAIGYPVVDQSHAALAEALERWTELSAWGRLDHRRRIEEIIAQGPPTIPEEVSYLERALAQPEHLRFFTAAATSIDWLHWTANQPQFNLLFTAAPADDADAEAIARALSIWFIDHFACVEDHSAAALRIARDRPWTYNTWDTLVHRLLTGPGPISDWQVPWLILALHRAPEGRHELLDMMLAEDKYQAWPEVALALLEHRTTPVPQPGIDFGDDRPPRLDVTLTGEEYWLTTAWTTIFAAMLTEHASHLFDLAIQQLRRMYRLAHLLQPSFDPIGLGRSAIEPHPQDEFREPHDMLIDAARDTLEHLLRTAPDAAAHHLEVLATATESILQRLCVHGWRLRTDRTPDAKLKWVIDQDLLYDLDLKHEVYQLLADALPAAEPGTVENLLAAANSGPLREPDRANSSYARYNLLSWLHQAQPDNPQVRAAFDAVQDAHRDYRPRPHPDLNMYMTSGFVEDAEPFSADELHAMIAADPETALHRLRGFAPTGESRLTGPTWTGALTALRGCIARYPGDGIRLAGHLSHGDHDLRATLIRGWSAAPLAPDEDLPNQIISLIGTWDLDAIRREAAELLAGTGQPEAATAWHDLAPARHLARKLWPTTETTGKILGGTDTLLEAINHPAGDLAQFWINVAAAEWRRQGEMWAGLPSVIVAELDRMIEQPDHNGELARCILIAHLRFFHGADPAWAGDRLLSLLDWNQVKDVQQVAIMWRTFLGRPQYDDSLLSAGLLDLFLDTTERTADVADDRTMESLGRQLATIAVRSDEPPTAWLPRLSTAAPPVVRLAWIRSVGRQLADMAPEETEALWTRWIRSYWSDRVSSIPRPLTPDEASAIAGWVLGLPAARAEAIGLVERVPTALERDDRILYQVAKMDSLEAEAPLWSRYLVHLLKGTSADGPWSVCHTLSKILPRLREGTSRAMYELLVDEAIGMGCDSAPDW